MNVGYAEKKLEKALSDQLQELEEKVKMAEQTRAYFGEAMYKKLMEIDETRNDALSFQGMSHFGIFRNRTFMNNLLGVTDNIITSFLFYQIAIL